MYSYNCTTDTRWILPSIAGLEARRTPVFITGQVIAYLFHVRRSCLPTLLIDQASIRSTPQVEANFGDRVINLTHQPRSISDLTGRKTSVDDGRVNLLFSALCKVIQPNHPPRQLSASCLGQNPDPNLGKERGGFRAGRMVGYITMYKVTHNSYPPPGHSLGARPQQANHAHSPGSARNFPGVSIYVHEGKMN